MKSVLVFGILAVSAGHLALPMFAHAEVIGIWLFDEEDGKLIKDSSGNGYDGEIIGTAKRRPQGRRGRALEFFEAPDRDGGSLWPGYVAIPHNDNQDLHEFSLTAWVKIPELLTPFLNEHDVSISQVIVGKMGHIQRYNYALWISGAGFEGALAGEAGHVTFGFTVSDPEWDQIFVEETGRRAEIIDNKWHHVAGTYQEPMLALYVDGQEVGRQENQPVNNPALPGGKEIPKPTFGRTRGKPGPFMIGAGHIGPQNKNQRPSYGVEGLIDEVGLFNHALSKDDIKIISRHGLAQFLSVRSRGKLAATWGKIKVGH